MVKFRLRGQNAQKHSTDEGSTGTWYNPVFTLVCVSFLITLNLFLFLPSVIYQGNMDEFPVPFTSILYFFLTPAAGLMLVSIAIGLLLPKTLQRVYISVLFIVGLLIYLQGNLIVWKYGLLDGQGIDWSISTWRGYVDGLLWVFFLLLACLFYKPVSRIVLPVTLVLIFVQLCLIGYSIVQQPERWKEKEKTSPLLLPPQELFQFSSGQNVIHILMDAFQSDIFQEIIEEDPDFYHNTLQGFTFFRETTGLFPTTRMSIPALFSGKIYHNDVPMPHFLNTVLKGRTIANALYDKGYDVDFALTIGGIATPGKYTLRYVIPVPYGVTDKDYKKANSALMLDLVLFRCAPHFLKKYVYNDQEWLIQRLNLTQLGLPFLSNKDRKGVSIRYFSYNAFIDDMVDNMTVNRDKPVYKFIHLVATHTPMVINNDCGFAGHALPHTRKNKIIQCKCSFFHIIEFLNKLKEMDIFDSSLIILSADTGDGISVDLKNRDNSIAGDAINSMKYFPNIVGSALPLMAIKPPNEKGPFEISNAQTMLSDIPATVNAILNLDMNFQGQNAFQIDPNHIRERKFYYYTWRHKNWQDDYFDRMDEFIIRGSVFDRSAWRKGATLYPPINSKKDNILGKEGFSNSIKIPQNFNINNIIIKKGEIFKIPLLLENTSKQEWIVQGNNKISLAYHWLKKTGEVVIHDGIRSPIHCNVNPADKVEISAKVKAPNAAGEYVLEFDMVQEQVAWFGSRGAKTLRLEVLVK